MEKFDFQKFWQKKIGRKNIDFFFRSKIFFGPTIFSIIFIFDQKIDHLLDQFLIKFLHGKYFVSGFI